jgi:hypothetical protein
MLKLDPESADLIAAQAIQRALSARPELYADSVESTLSALLETRMLDDKVATYALLHPDRFCLMPPPQFFDAKWRVEPNLIRAGASSV